MVGQRKSTITASSSCRKTKGSIYSKATCFRLAFEKEHFFTGHIPNRTTLLPLAALPSRAFSSRSLLLCCASFSLFLRQPTGFAFGVALLNGDRQFCCRSTRGATNTVRIRRTSIKSEQIEIDGTATFAGQLFH